ncbi:VCBS domain-containing protein, partial [Pelagimonas varians]
FTYTVTDEFGAIDTATVTLTIEGRNDGPVAVADTNAGAAVVESGVTPGNIPFAGNDTATGNLLDNDTDVDATDMLSVSEVNGQAANVAGSVAGTYGTVVINSDGGYTYTLLNNAPATEALPQDETAQDVFTYTVDDGNGGTDTATLTIDITGTNDAPTITTGFGTAVEDGPIVSVDLAPLAGDVDSDDTAAT